MYSLEFVSLRVLTERIQETSMEPNFQAQKNRRISARKLFRKIVNPREHTTMGRG